MRQDAGVEKSKQKAKFVLLGEGDPLPRTWWHRLAEHSLVLFMSLVCSTLACATRACGSNTEACAEAALSLQEG